MPEPTLPGRYSLLLPVGEGGSARIWAAMDTVGGEKVAVKVPLRPDYGAHIPERFAAEFRTAARFQHPNILRGSGH